MLSTAGPMPLAFHTQLNPCRLNLGLQFSSEPPYPISQHSAYPRSWSPS